MELAGLTAVVDCKDSGTLYEHTTVLASSLGVSFGPVDTRVEESCVVHLYWRKGR